ncbi:TetR/AcrR family transcriptional regulator [Pseudonocardia sp. WMMC193]|uniref:TetR/AcrR family transcriptional regulator n=1 Tax=Pseudonocardia sp. WMMC193 TaxID=2911965 RepID=UPI001F3A0B2B|nr:TetR/AcrR family transcriptional regulator [Pseudonocardia sp. WMMC193]MCF7550282.1 TetR/AcrR family transcriptional regulator [Pseudonocardia sp. WMMC193]
MLGETWQDRRRASARGEILAVAWEVARRDGLGGLTLRAVADGVGMRAPSLYTHFASKNALYDAMFGQAWQEFAEAFEAVELPAEPRAALHAIARFYVGFATADLVRHQLMDQRVLPDFAPSPESYAPSLRAMERTVARFRALGPAVSDADVDLFVAALGGIVAAQWSNDPGGDRYVRLLGRMVDLLADDLGLPRPPEDPPTARPDDPPTARPEDPPAPPPEELP